MKKFKLYQMKKVGDCTLLADGNNLQELKDKTHGFGNNFFVNWCEGGTIARKKFSGMDKWESIGNI